MSNEYAQYRVERNPRRDERARREAWDEADTLLKLERKLSSRMDEARREYGPAVLGSLRQPPRPPGRTCERAEIERYVQELRAYCAAVEKQIEHGIAAARQAIAEAWEEARSLQERRRLLQERIDGIVRGAGGPETPAFDDPPVEPPEDCARAVVETYVRDLRRHCAAVEKRINRIERDQRREEEAWARARGRARELQDRERRLQERIAEARRRYGDGVVAALPQSPAQPSDPCERSTFEQYVRELRAHCVAAERRISQDEDVAKRACNDAWEQARALGSRWESLRERIAATAASGGEGARPVPQPPAEDCSLDEIRAHVEKMQAHCDAVEAQALDENARAERRATERAFVEAFGWERTSLDDLARRHDEAAGGAVPPEDDAGDREDAARREAMEVLDALSPSAPAEESMELDRIADQLVEARVGRQDRRADELLHELRAGVRSANDREAQRTHDAEKALGLRRRLRGVEASAAADVVRELIAVETGRKRLDGALVARVEEIERRFSTGVDEAIAPATRDLTRAAELKAGLRGLDGDEVAAALGEIESVERGERTLGPDLEDRVEEAGRKARGRADRSYVALVMREELENLGYRAEEGVRLPAGSGGKGDRA